MDIRVFIDISLQLSMLLYPFGYPWISMDIHVLTCYGFSIQGSAREPPFPILSN